MLFVPALALTQDVSHSIHQVLLASRFTLHHSLLRQDEAGHDRLPLAQEEVQHVETGQDALRQGTADHRVVVAHCLQDHAHVPDGPPLDRQSRKTVVVPLLAHSLHGGIGISVVALASVATATADRREGHKVTEVCTQVSCHPGRGAEARLRLMKGPIAFLTLPQKFKCFCLTCPDE